MLTIIMVGMLVGLLLYALLAISSGANVWYEVKSLMMLRAGIIKITAAAVFMMGAGVTLNSAAKAVWGLDEHVEFLLYQAGPEFDDIEIGKNTETASMKVPRCIPGRRIGWILPWKTVTADRCYKYKEGSGIMKSTLVIIEKQVPKSKE